MKLLPRDAFARPIPAVAIALVIVAMSSALVAGCGGGNKSQNNAPESSTSSTTPGATSTAPESGGTAATPAGFDPATTFQQKCATCHGPSGHGDGPAAAGLNPKPRNYHDKAYMSTRTDQQLHDSIFNGKSQMPAWGKTGVLTDQQVWAMVKYVRGLSQQP